jgi:hypothetical protein
MKKLLFYLGITLLIACENKEEGPLNDLVVQKEDGSQEVKVEQLSIEDIARLESEAGKQGESYQGVLNNDIEKTYNLKADTNHTISWRLQASQPNASLFLYKEFISSVKKDSLNYVKVKEYKLVCQEDSCIQKNKKQTNYKAVVKLNPKFSTLDSTCEFTLIVTKN